MTDPTFKQPGSEYLTQQKLGTPSLSSPEVFSKPKSGFLSGGGGPRRKVDDFEERNNSQFEKDKAEQKKREEAAASEDAPPQNVILRDLHWDDKKGTLNETSKAYASADLPDEIKIRTRIVFTLEYKDEGGQWKFVSNTDGHLKNGEAIAEIELKLPAGEKVKEDSETLFRFRAKHSFSKPMLGPEIKAKLSEEKDFDGDIFYSPTNGDYLMLPSEEDSKDFMVHLAEIANHSESLQKLAKIPDAKNREKEAEKASREIAALFGGGSTSESHVFEEMVQVRRSKSWGKKKGWIYITPRLRESSKSKGHFRKEYDATLKKAVDKMLKRHGGSEKTEIFEGKFTRSFLKTDPKAGVWPLNWYYPNSKNESSKKTEEENSRVVFTPEAAVCRYLVGFDGIDTTFDPKAKKIEVAASGSASYAIFEGKLSWALAIPDKNGIDLLSLFKVKNKQGYIVDPKRVCRFLVTLEAHADTFVGVSASAAVKFPSIDLSKKNKKAQTAEARVGGSAFAGAQAGVGAQVKAQWKPLKTANWLELCKTAGEIQGIAGASAQANLGFKLKGNKIYYHHELGGAVGLGLKNSVEWELDFGQAFEFMGHIMNSFEYHRILGIDDEVYKAYTHYAFVWMTEGAEKAKELTQDAIHAANTFGEWLSKAKKSIGKFKSQILNSSVQSATVAKCPDHVIAQAIVTVMYDYNVDDFRVLRYLLCSAESTHKLKWILRRVANPNLPVGEEISDAESGKLLSDGIGIIKLFPQNVKLKQTEKQKVEDFQNDFDSILREKQITP